MSKTATDVPITLASQDINLIIEALLFSASVEIGADWEEPDYYAMVEIAKKLKEIMGNKIKLDNISLFKCLPYDEKQTELIEELFGGQLKVELSTYAELEEKE